MDGSKKYYKYDSETLSLYCGKKYVHAPWKCFDKETQRFWPIDYWMMLILR